MFGSVYVRSTIFPDSSIFLKKKKNEHVVKLSPNFSHNMSVGNRTEALGKVNERNQEVIS